MRNKKHKNFILNNSPVYRLLTASRCLWICLVLFLNICSANFAVPPAPDNLVLTFPSYRTFRLEWTGTPVDDPTYKPLRFEIRRAFLNPEDPTAQPDSWRTISITNPSQSSYQLYDSSYQQEGKLVRIEIREIGTVLADNTTYQTDWRSVNSEFLPLRPINLSAIETDGNFQVSWERHPENAAISNLSYYYLYRGYYDANVANPLANTFNHYYGYISYSTLNSNSSSFYISGSNPTTYTDTAPMSTSRGKGVAYRVYEYGSWSVGSTYNYSTFITPWLLAGITKPYAPANVTITTLDGVNTVTWTRGLSDDPEYQNPSYQVYRVLLVEGQSSSSYNTSSGEWNYYNTTFLGTVTATSFTDSNPPVGRKMFYIVRETGSHTSTPSRTYTTVFSPPSETLTLGPQNPTITTLERGQEGGYKIVWQGNESDPSVNITSHELQYSSNNSTWYTFAEGLYPDNTYTYYPSGDLPSSFYFRIRENGTATFGSATKNYTTDYSPSRYIAAYPLPNLSLSQLNDAIKIVMSSSPPPETANTLEQKYTVNCRYYDSDKGIYSQWKTLVTETSETETYDYPESIGATYYYEVSETGNWKGQPTGSRYKTYPRTFSITLLGPSPPVINTAQPTFLGNYIAWTSSTPSGSYSAYTPESYDIERMDTAQNKWEFLTNVTSTSFYDYEVEGNKTYRYRIAERGKTPNDRPYITRFSSYSNTITAKVLPASPANLRVTSAPSWYEIAWDDGGRNEGYSILGYKLYRRSSLAETPTPLNTIPMTELSYQDMLSGDDFSQNFYYSATKIFRPDGESETYETAPSAEACAIVPQAAPIAHIRNIKNSTLVHARWEPYPLEVVKTFVGIAEGEENVGTDNFVSFIDVGHATEHTFKELRLKTGVPYYITVKFQNSEAYLAKTHTFIGSSRSFNYNRLGLLRDDNLESFNQCESLVNCQIVLNSENLPAIKPKVFRDNSLKTKYRKLTVTEGGAESRFNAPAEFTFTGNPVGLRVYDEFGKELPLYRFTGTNEYVTLTNQPKGSIKNYHLFYGAGTQGNSTFTMNTEATSQKAWTPYYSRKLLPPGVENFQVSDYTEVQAPGNTDDGCTLVTLPWTFNFFNRSFSSLYFGTNSYLTGTYFTQYHNYFHIFTGGSTDGMIAIMWVDTMIKRGAPQNSGFYRKHVSQGLGDERIIFYTRANRYARTDDIYIHQGVLYKTGDIALRYEYLSPSALHGDPQVGTDKPLVDNTLEPNVTVEKTVGISNQDNTNWLVALPLIRGIGKTPTSFFQYKNACQTAITDEETAPSGLLYAGHFESRIMDAGVNAPKWKNFRFTAKNAGNSLYRIYVRSGNSCYPDETWQDYQLIAENQGKIGSYEIDISAILSGRFAQYKCEFLPESDPLQMELNYAEFTCESVEITNISSGMTEISQGQKNISVEVTLANNYPGAGTVDWLGRGTGYCFFPDTVTLSFNGSQDGYQTRFEETSFIPVPGNGGTRTYEFLVDADANCEPGDYKIDASMSGTLKFRANITDNWVEIGYYSDDSSDQIHEWTLLEKPLIVIEKVETPDNFINKGKHSYVSMTISNKGGTPFALTSAHFTYNFEGYEQFYYQPPETELTSERVVINPGDKITLRKRIEVLPGCTSGVDTLDAALQGKDTLSGKIYSVAGAAITDSWTVQNPASIIIEKITAPALVYLGQVGVPVQIAIKNQGEALLKITDADIDFPNNVGTYLLPHFKVTEFPIETRGGYTATATIDVSVMDESPTGQEIIDASASGTDVNSDEALFVSNAQEQATWQIVAQTVKTYKDPSYLIPHDSFTRPPPDKLPVPVYIKTEKLINGQEYIIKAYKPDGSLFKQSPIPLMANHDGVDGVIKREVHITSDLPYGKWKIEVTDPVGDNIYCETYFYVVDPANPSLSLQLPEYVSTGQKFTCTASAENSGGASFLDASLSLEILQPAEPDNLVTAFPDTESNPNPSPKQLTVEGFAEGTFNYLLTANKKGTFRIRGQGSGLDANSDLSLTTANVFSNYCTVQNKSILEVISLNIENPSGHTIPRVYRNQKALYVDATLRNSGEAAAFIDSITLDMLRGTSNNNSSYNIQLDPAIVFPYKLNGNTTKTFRFFVDVNPEPELGINTLKLRVSGRDANDPERIFTNLSPPSDPQWEIVDTIVLISDNSNYNPEKFTFSLGQNVFAKFMNLPKETWYKCRWYRLGTSLVYTSPDLNSGTAAEIDDLRYIEPLTQNIGKWRITAADKSSGNILGEVYFTVQRAPTLVASLEISPSEISIGQEFQVKMTLKNPAADAAKVLDAYCSAFEELGLGKAVLKEAPEILTQDVLPNNVPTTYIWTYEATEDSGDSEYWLTTSGSFAASGIDINSSATVTAPSVISNKVRILKREITLLKEGLPIDNVDFGSANPGTQTPNVSLQISNTGNTNLTNLKWNLTDFAEPNGARISKGHIIAQPQNINSLGASESQTATLAISIPANQSEGEYTTSISYYADLNNNDIQDSNEPYKRLTLKLQVSGKAQLELKFPAAFDAGIGMDVIDFGGMRREESKILPLRIKNVGNVPFEKLELQCTAGTIYSFVSNYKAEAMPEFTYASNVHSISIGSLGLDQEKTVNFIITPSADLNEAQDGITYLKFKIFEDYLRPSGSSEPPLYNRLYDNDEYNIDFALKVNLGDKMLSLTPNSVEMQDLVPATPIDEQHLTLKNEGTVPLQNLKAAITDLTFETNIIPARNITLVIPKGELLPGETMTIKLAATIPGATVTGLYTGTALIYEDLNNNNTLDPEELTKIPLNLNFGVVLDEKFYIINSSIDLGDAKPTTAEEEVTLSNNVYFRNNGNVPLSNFKWIPANLINEQHPNYSIPITEANFTIDPNFICQPYRSPSDDGLSVFSFTIPLGAIPGHYKSPPVTLYSDKNNNNILDDDEPNWKTHITCNIGNILFDVMPKQLEVTGKPNSKSNSINFKIINTGNLRVSRPTIHITENLKHVTVPSQSLSENTNIFSPSKLPGSILPAAEKFISWQVNIPPSLLTGTYKGKAIVYNDTDGTGTIPSDTDMIKEIILQLEIEEAASFNIQPSSTNPLYELDLTGETFTETQGSFFIRNTGNTNLTNIRTQLASLKQGIHEISASNMTVSQNLSIPFEGEGEAEVTVKIGNVLPGNYNAQFVSYIDSNGNAQKDDNEFAVTFDVKLLVKNRHFEISPSPLDFGNAQSGQTISKNLSYSNVGEVNILPLSYNFSDLTNQHGDKISVSNVTISSLESLEPKQSKTALVNIAIPHNAYFGNYTTTAGQNYFWDNTDTNSQYDPGNELMKSVPFKVTLPRVEKITSDTYTGSTYKFGGPSATESGITFKNTSNFDFTSITLNSYRIRKPDGSELHLPASGNEHFKLKINNETIDYLSPLKPGAELTAELTIIPPATSSSLFPEGTYTIDSVTFILNDAKRGIANLSLNAETEIMFLLGTIYPEPDFPSGENRGIYQVLKSDNFTPGNYILSAWVSPSPGGTGKIYLATANKDGEIQNISWVSVNSNGAAIASDYSSLSSEAHITEKMSFAIQKNESSPKEQRLYYRIFLKHTFTAESLAPDAIIYIGLVNNTPEQHDVIFDGIKLEKAFEGQKKPTSYHPGTILHTPNKTLSRDGKQYYEW